MPRQLLPLGLALLSLTLFIPSVHSAGQPNLTGQPCQIANTRLAVDSNQLISDCGHAAWCDATTSTCKPIGCRRDEFPFGLGERANWPDFCPQGQFCPDEAFGCLPVINVGGACQLSRDDQCQPPPSTEAGDSTLCLKNTCTYVNATEGQACINDNVLYTIYATKISTYGNVVSRDNCRQGLYCDAPTLVCKPRLPLGQPCSADKECQSDVCLDPSYTSQDAETLDFSGKCAPAFDKRRYAPAWVFVLVTLGIIVALTLLCTTLSCVHRRNRRKAVKEREEYYATQTGYRDDIHQIYEAAKSSYHLPNSPFLGATASVQGSPRRSMSHTPLFTNESGHLAAAPNAGGPTGAGYAHGNSAPSSSSNLGGPLDAHSQSELKHRSSRLSSMAYDVQPPSDDDEDTRRVTRNAQQGLGLGAGGDPRASYGAHSTTTTTDAFGGGAGRESHFGPPASRGYYDSGIVSTYYQDLSLDEGNKRMAPAASSSPLGRSGGGMGRVMTVDSTDSTTTPMAPGTAGASSRNAAASNKDPFALDRDLSDLPIESSTDTSPSTNSARGSGAEGGGGGGGGAGRGSLGKSPTSSVLGRAANFAAAARRRGRRV